MYSKINLYFTRKKYKKFAKITINKYLKVLKLIKFEENLFDIKEILRVHNADFGVCKMMEGFEKNYTIQDLINDFKVCDSQGNIDNPQIPFWFKAPYYAESKDEVIELINKRISILKEWL
jgi:hypothetical protein